MGPPPPSVAKPQRRKDLQRCDFRPAVCDADLDEYVFRCPLGILHKNVKVSIVFEYAGVQELIFKIASRASSVRTYQVEVGVLTLRILIQAPHVGMSRSAVQREVV